MVTEPVEKWQLAKNLCYRDLPANYGVKDLPGLSQVLPTFAASGFTVVELGTGGGHVAASVKQRLPEARVVATDLVVECLERVQRNFPNLEVAQVDADEQLPFGDASVNLVISSNLFEHLHDYQTHLREVFRILRPGGSYFVSTPHIVCDCMWTLVMPSGSGRVRELVGRLRGDRSTSHCNLQAISSLRRKLQTAGFEVEVLQRKAFSSNERDKLEQVVAWAPLRLRRYIVAQAEACWLRLPRCLQPTIAMHAVRK